MIRRKPPRVPILPKRNPSKTPAGALVLTGGHVALVPVVVVDFYAIERPV